MLIAVSYNSLFYLFLGGCRYRGCCWHNPLVNITNPSHMENKNKNRIPYNKYLRLERFITELSILIEIYSINNFNMYTGCWQLHIHKLDRENYITTHRI